MHATGDHSITDLAEVFSVSRPTVYRTLQVKTNSSPPEAAPHLIGTAFNPAPVCGQ